MRSRGLIAAIEPVEIAASAQWGLVIEQDPSAGTQMVREGVVTLRVGQSPATLPRTEDAAEDRLASRSAGGGNGSEDDTAEWFATLRPSVGAPVLGPGAVAPRRRRKHRRAATPVEDMAFDTPPDPLPAVPDLLICPCFGGVGLLNSGWFGCCSGSMGRVGGEGCCRLLFLELAVGEWKGLQPGAAASGPCLFDLGGGAHPERGVPAAGVVPDLDVVMYR